MAPAASRDRGGAADRVSLAVSDTSSAPSDEKATIPTESRPLECHPALHQDSPSIARVSATWPMLRRAFPCMVEAVPRADAGFAPILDQWAAAESEGDVDTLTSLLHADFRGDDPRGFVLTKQEWLDRHRGGEVTARRFQWNLTEVGVRNGVAVAIGTHRQWPTSGDIQSAGRFRATLVAVDRGGRWHIVNVQLVPHPLARLSLTSAGARPAPPVGEPSRVPMPGGRGSINGRTDGWSRAVRSRGVPAPALAPHATCLWCKGCFPTIVDLLDHVDARHPRARPAA